MFSISPSIRVQYLRLAEATGTGRTAEISQELNYLFDLRTNLNVRNFNDLEIPTLQPDNKLSTICRPELPGISSKKTAIESELKSATLCMINTTYENYKKIYSDGSKRPQGTAAAFYCAEHQSCRSKTLHNESSILNAELEAIRLSLAHTCLEHSDSNEGIVILTDSKSAVMGLGALHQGNSVPHHMIDVVECINLILDRGMQLFIQWIPGHVEGVYGSFRADRAAFHAAAERDIHPEAFTMYHDLEPIFKTKIQEEWRIEYDIMTQRAGSWAKYILDVPDRQPWFINLQLKPRITTSLNRILLGHGFTEKFKVQMRKSDISNLFCEHCLPIEHHNDLYHIFECRAYAPMIQQFIHPFNHARDFIKANIEDPSRLAELVELLHAANIKF